MSPPIIAGAIGGTAVVVTAEQLGILTLGTAAIISLTPQGQDAIRGAWQELQAGTEALVITSGLWLSQAQSAFPARSTPTSSSGGDANSNPTPPKPELPPGIELLILGRYLMPNQTEEHSLIDAGDGLTWTPEEQEQFYRGYRIQQLRVRLMNDPDDILAKQELHTALTQDHITIDETTSFDPQMSLPAMQENSGFVVHMGSGNRRLSERQLKLLMLGQITEIRFGINLNVVLYYDASLGRFFIYKESNDGLASLYQRDRGLMPLESDGMINPGWFYAVSPSQNLYVEGHMIDLSALEKFPRTHPHHDETRFYDLGRVSLRQESKSIAPYLLGGNLRSMRNLGYVLKNMRVGSSFQINGKETDGLENPTHPDVMRLKLKFTRLANDKYEIDVQAGTLQINKRGNKSLSRPEIISAPQKTTFSAGDEFWIVWE